MHLSTGPVIMYKCLKSLLPCGRAADNEGEDGLHMLEPVLVTAVIVVITTAEEAFLLHHLNVTLIPTDLGGWCSRCLQHLHIILG